MKTFKMLKPAAIIGYIVLAVVLFSSCCSNGKHTELNVQNNAKWINVKWVDVNGYVSKEEFTIIIVDSCEYLLSEYDRSRMITHKGNCKFCESRSLNNR